MRTTFASKRNKFYTLVLIALKYVNNREIIELSPVFVHTCVNRKEHKKDMKSYIFAAVNKKDT